MSSIELRGLRKVFANDVVALDGVDLRVDDGEVVALLGPTGCGNPPSCG
jgi:ABC-type sugar transport system ATPase subunit